MSSDHPRAGQPGADCRQGVVTITMNPAFDLTCFISTLPLGKVGRLRAQRLDCGGKGVNVACFLAGFEVPVIATGFVGESNSEPFRQPLRQSGTEDRCIAVPGATRTNVKLVEEAIVLVTDLNASGFAVRHEDEARLIEAVAGAGARLPMGRGRGQPAVRLPHRAGSPPGRGRPRRRRAGDARYLRQAAGAALEAHPDAIKPNRKE